MKLCFLNSLKYYHFGNSKNKSANTQTDESISMCRQHLPDPHTLVEAQETTEQHDTPPPQPMTGHNQKRRGSTSPGKK